MSIDQFFLLFAVIHIAARVFSETAARFGIPAVIGELAAALLLIALTTLLPPFLLKAFYSRYPLP